MTKRAADRRFFGVLGTTFVLLFVAWNFIVPNAPTTFPMLNQAEENRARIVRFALSPPTPVVLAGSSLMYRIVQEYFSTSTSNIGVAGGSPVLGATIAASRPPKVLVVEINILDRAIDRVLLADGVKAASPPFGLPALGMVTTPVRAVVAWGYDLDRIGTEYRQSAKVRGEALLAGSPAAAAPDNAYAAQVAAWDERPLDIEQMRESAMALRKALDTVEAAGGKGYYIQLPMHKSLSATPYAKSSIDTIRLIDPKFSERFLTVPWSEEIRWDDGAHVDQRSAVIVARQIEQAIGLPASR